MLSHHDRAQRRRSTIDPLMLQHMESKGMRMDYHTDQEYTEVERIKQVDIIKQMSVSMGVKRRLRNKLFDRMPEVSDDTCRAFWYRQSTIRLKARLRLELGWREFTANTTLWNKAFKNIEGHFGSGVVTYFRFMKSLFLMNVALFLAMFLFVVVPMVAFPEGNYNTALTGNATDCVSLASNCSQRYEVNSTGLWYEYIIHFLQGTGFMEKTVLFYGYYADRELNLNFLNYNYNLPFAYITCINVCLAISLFTLVTLSAQGFRQRLFSNEDSLRQYCNKILAGWDYTLNDEKNIVVKQKTIRRDVLCCIELERDLARRRNRTSEDLCKVWSKRAFINLIVACMLGTAAYLIYFTTVKTIEITTSTSWDTYHILLQFLVEYMTSLTITILNALLPIVFKKLITFEDYTTAFQVNFTVARTVFLRLASIAVLLFSLYVSVSCSTKDYCNVGTGSCTSLECWETYVGQEFYKLVIMDFIVVVAVVFFVEFPRRLVVTKCHCKLLKLVGQQEFDISKNIIDLVYMQTLMWLGLLFSPLIPAITVVKNVIVFYLKMLTTLKNYVPSTASYKASDSQHFFHILLLTSFTACVIPCLYVMWEMTPSRGCGPFRIYGTMIDIVPITISTWPSTLTSIINFLCSTGVVVAGVVMLIVVIHYMRISVSAYKDKLAVMKEQVFLEGQDKQFLLANLQQKPTGAVTALKVMSAIKDTKMHTEADDIEAQSLETKPKIPDSPEVDTVSGHQMSHPHAPLEDI